MSAVLTVEEGAVCQGDIKKLKLLYQNGVRMLTLTWNYPNELGYPNLEREMGRKAWKMHQEVKEMDPTAPEWSGRQAEADSFLRRYLNTPDTCRGLTPKGIEFVTVMEELGMIIDVSHLSDAGFDDVCKYTKKPFVASHSNARSICPCVRNLTDDMIRRLAERGGVIGLNFCADFLTQPPAGSSNPGRLRDIVRHARHIADIGGIECLGLGSDFDGIDTHEELPGADKMHRLWEALGEGGFTESQRERIFALNVLRLYEETLQ